ncbi:MAG: acyl-CoA thioesterase [bacterium]
MIKPYFPRQEGAPPPLRIRMRRQVRFEEVDPLGMVWHGRYPGYFEDARVGLGEKYGLGYLDFQRHQVMAPIKQLVIDYHLPLRFHDAFTIEGILHWSEAARINYEFVIRDSAERVTTTGCSVQLLLDASGQVLLVVPPFCAELRERWRQGVLT